MSTFLSKCSLVTFLFLANIALIGQNATTNTSLLTPVPTGNSTQQNQNAVTPLITTTNNNVLDIKSLVPESFHSHPEYGKVKLEGSPESIELIHMREPFSRTFQNPDGSFSKQQTGGFFHYTDENGQLVSFGNILELEGEKFYSLSKTGLPIRINASNGITVMTLEKGKSMVFGNNINMSLVDVEGNLISENVATKENSFTELNNVITTYDIFPGINRVQTVDYYQVETDFIINTKPELPSSDGFVYFSEDYKLPEGWSIVESSEGIRKQTGWEGELIILNAADEEVGKLLVPLYYDSYAPELDDQLNTEPSEIEGEVITKHEINDHSIIGTYQWEKLANENNTYKISVVVSVDWLMDEERVYPVTIDPTATNTYSAGNINSCFWTGVGSRTMDVTTCANSTVTNTVSSWEYRALNTAWRSDVFTRIGGTNATYQWFQCALNSGGFCGIAAPAFTNDIADGFYATGLVPITIGITRLFGGAGCNATYAYIVNNTWIETVTYTCGAAPVVCNTCATPCGSAQGFAVNPTVAAVVAGCTTAPFTPVLPALSTNTFCYAFQATAATVSFNVIITSNCGVGNVTNFSWSLYNFPACGAPIQTGIITGLTFFGLTVGNNYVFCYTFDVPGGCTHSQHCPFFVGATPFLPVELTTFTAESYENSVINLDWITQSEVNNDFFTLEKSLDAQNFELVATVDGAGNSTVANNYNHVDNNPFQGTSYYRLKQTDFNGEFEYSEIVPVNITSDNELTIYPNPVNSDLKIAFKSDDDNSDIYIKVYNIQGALILQHRDKLVIGMNEISVDMEKYSNGLYFITVEHNGIIKNMKFAKE